MRSEILRSDQGNVDLEKDCSAEQKLELTGLWQRAADPQIGVDRILARARVVDPMTDAREKSLHVVYGGNVTFGLGTVD